MNNILELMTRLYAIEHEMGTLTESLQAASRETSSISAGSNADDPSAQSAMSICSSASRNLQSAMAMVQQAQGALEAYIPTLSK